MGFHKRLWEAWKRLAHKIARFNSLVLTSVLYYVVLPFVAIPFRLTKDPLRLKNPARFHERAAAGDSLEKVGRQG